MPSNGYVVDFLTNTSPLASSERKALDGALAPFRLALARGRLAAWQVYARPTAYLAACIKEGASPRIVYGSTVRELAAELARAVDAKRVSRAARRQAARPYRALPPTSRVIEVPMVSELGLATAHAIAEKWCAVARWRGGPAKEFTYHSDAVRYATDIATTHAEDAGESASVLVHVIPRTNLTVRWTVASLREDFAVTRVTVTSC